MPELPKSFMLISTRRGPILLVCKTHGRLGLEFHRLNLGLGSKKPLYRIRIFFPPWTTCYKMRDAAYSINLSSISQQNAGLPSQGATHHLNPNGQFLPQLFHPLKKPAQDALSRSVATQVAFSCLHQIIKNPFFYFCLSSSCN